MCRSRMAAQRLSGVLLVLLCIAALIVSGDGDATCIVVLLPVGGWMIFGKTNLFATCVERSGNMNRYTIKHVRGHYEVYFGNKFICSGDTRDECIEAIEEMMAA